MTDNEKLIKEAATRLLKDVNPKHGRPVNSQLAADIRLVAGAVFEKAHTPTDDERGALAEKIKLAGHLAAEMMVFQGDSYPVKAIPYTSFLHILDGFRRTSVPEPSADAEVIGEWFTSSHGVAVVAVAPMTDRGPAVMVDGRVISPNDVAALVEFKAQGEPSDAQVLAADDAMLSFRSGTQHEMIRAMLRAASAITEQGENR